ncbi:prolipoprotein diacylglyceryl transferase [Hyalangium minutum]|uniref:Prolipoprotein diacylglyceryl transferase n=1 Tax=Hyalangium minutum TaxID=394096 RepID=A0A085WKY3_9BACT|nr:prolipoprotein diacylglyceryl transferase [Hyalangium minutum]KFE68346.1 Prolipoprotein diacylglyceryl transferase [Hyalangium minutum]
MIPYVNPHSLKVGPIEPFGIFVALGIFLAARIVVKQSAKQGLDPNPIHDYAPWGVGAGVVAGHLVHLLFYHPEELSKSPFQLFKVWDGLSSFGGLLGGVIAAIIYFKIRGVSFSKYADAFALGVAPGWGVARLGCFVAHDHPGSRTDFFLAVNFPADVYGGPRHDLGMYDAILLFAITGVLFALRNSGKLQNRLLHMLALLYAPGRFFFDTLRATDLRYVDARYLGLTPAQYGCILLVVYGLWGLATKRASAPGSAPPSTASGSVKTAR